MASDDESYGVGDRRLSKTERFRLFIERLAMAPSAGNEAEAFTLLSDTLNHVEDEFSGIPCNPFLWNSDGRMYPPQADNRREVIAQPGLCRYRSVAHNTFIGVNGSIRVETANGVILLDKAGADGRSAAQFDP